MALLTDEPGERAASAVVAGRKRCVLLTLGREDYKVCLRTWQVQDLKEKIAGIRSSPHYATVAREYVLHVAQMYAAVNWWFDNLGLFHHVALPRARHCHHWQCCRRRRRRWH